MSDQPVLIPIPPDEKVPAQEQPPGTISVPEPLPEKVNPLKQPEPPPNPADPVNPAAPTPPEPAKDPEQPKQAEAVAVDKPLVTVDRYAKFIVAAIFAAMTSVSSAITDGKITFAETVSIAMAALTAVGVYVVPNAP